jgi:parallel beta-helix repeat protein
MHQSLHKAARSAAFVLVLAAAHPALGVDGVTEINDARAQAGGTTPTDTPGYPVTLDHPGSYRLTGSLTVTDPNVTAIVITSPDVTIDMNGFTIACNTGGGPCGAGSGVGIDGNQANVTIRNGTVRDMGGAGIVTGSIGRVVGVRAISNHDHGIDCGNGSTLNGNTAITNGRDGLNAGIGSSLTDNVSIDNDHGGLEVSQNSTLIGNTANSNTVFGIYCNGGCTIEHNTTNQNATGISLLGGCTVTGNTARINTGFGLNVTGTDTAYSFNTFTGNNGGGDAAQVSGGTPIGVNFCGTNTACP